MPDFTAPMTIAGVAPFVETFGVRGNLAVGVGGARWYANRPITVTNIRASVGTAPVGASLIVDVNKNGVTMFTTQANRPTVASGNFIDSASVPDVVAMAAGDYFTVDVDQVGSTTPGADLTVQIEYY
jgi:hypothetical protein